MNIPLEKNRQRLREARPITRHELLANMEASQDQFLVVVLDQEERLRLYLGTKQGRLGGITRLDQDPEGNFQPISFQPYKFDTIPEDVRSGLYFEGTRLDMEQLKSTISVSQTAAEITWKAIKDNPLHELPPNKVSIEFA